MNIVGPQTVKDFLKDRLQGLSIPDAQFIVSNTGPRSATLSKDLLRLELSAPDIESLENPYNKIGLLQYFYRFAGLQLMHQNIYLMHGSAAVVNDKGIVFGDDGSSIGKTTAMIETAFDTEGKEYVGDEFVFWDAKKILFSATKIFRYTFVK